MKTGDIFYTGKPNAKNRKKALELFQSGCDVDVKYVDVKYKETKWLLPKNDKYLFTPNT